MQLQNNFRDDYTCHYKTVRLNLYKNFRSLLVFGYLMYLFLITVMVLINEVESGGLIIFGLTLIITIYILPVILTPKMNFFNPVMFSAILFFFELLENSTIYAYGLTENYGLIGYNLKQLANVVFFSLILGFIGRTAYLIGYTLIPKLKIKKFDSQIPLNLNRKSIFLISLSLIIFAFYIYTRGGVVAHLVFLGKGRTNLINEGLLSGEWAIIGRLGILVSLIWLIFSADAYKKIVFWVFSIISLIPPYLAAGSRSNTAYFIIFGLLIWFQKSKKLDINKIAIIGLAVLIIIGGLGAVRESSWSGRIQLSEVFDGIRPIALMQRSISEIQFRAGAYCPTFPILEKVPDQVKPLNGESYISILVAPIPRAIWKDKPRTIGSIIGQEFLYSNDPVPPSPIAEAYWNFQTFGVIVVFLFFGAFHKFVKNIWENNTHNKSIVFLYLLTLFFLKPTTLSVIYWFQLFISSVLILLFFFVPIKENNEKGRNESLNCN